LRNGQFVGEYKTAELPRIELLGKMLGRQVEEEHTVHRTAIAADVTPTRRPFVEARGIGRRGSVGPLDLHIVRGEVLGLAGLLGSGRTETARMLFGIDPYDVGELSIGGEKARLRTPGEAIAHRFAYCSEDRKTEGILPHLSVRENLVFAMQASRGPFRLIPRAEQSRLAAHYIRALDIKTPGPETPIRNLSGGNQQKVLLARWLAMQPQLIILDEPTRGIDVGAKAEIEKLIVSLREKGMAVLFISSELEEVVRVSGRVAVLRDRKKVGELDGEFDEDRVLHLIAQPPS
jgi:monosaccharide-transporting ATPase